MTEKITEKIIVRAPNWIGDAVMCTPALMDLREACSTAKIILWARPTIADLLRAHPSIDEIFVYENNGIHRGILGKIALIRALRKGQFDLAVLFQNAFEAALLSFLGGIPERHGFATDGRRIFLSKAIPVQGKKGDGHQVQYYQELIRRIFGKASNRSPRLVVLREEEDRIAQRFPELSIRNENLLIGLNPGSVYGTAKRWLPDRFAETADRLVEKLEVDRMFKGNVQCVLVGAAGEEVLSQAIANRMRRKPLVLSGKTSIRELMAIIKRCCLFLTNDTGPMHIAAAFNVPLVAIFGPTDPRNTAPFANGETVVRYPVSCSPCLLRHCPIDHRCMTQISVDDVYRAAVAQFPKANFSSHRGNA